MNINQPGLSSKLKQILIVDDHPLVRAGISAMIQTDAELVVSGEVGSCGEAQVAAAAMTPDLVIIDLSLGDGSGLDLIKRLTSRHEGLRVLVCSMHDETLFAERALQAGAMGYINKQEATAHVIEAIRQVLDGKVYLSERMIARLLGNLTKRGPSETNPISDLSNRELQVFDLIGRGLGTSEIAERLHLSVKTIEAHRDRIKKKLGLNSGRELSRYAFQWTMELETATD